MTIADRPIPERLAECEQDILRTRGQQLVHEQRGEHTQAQATSHRIVVLLDIWAQLPRMNEAGCQVPTSMLRPVVFDAEPDDRLRAVRLVSIDEPSEDAPR